MLYGGAQDVALYFAPGLAPVSSWRVVLPAVGLVCGLVVLASAGFNLVWGWRLRRATGALERKLAGHVALVSATPMVRQLCLGAWSYVREKKRKSRTAYSIWITTRYTAGV